jgi:hypothetical protein
MRTVDAVLKAKPTTVRRTIPIRPPVGYEQFREMVVQAIGRMEHHETSRRGVVLISHLRRALPRVSKTTFNQHLLRMERNELVYLIPPEDPGSLSDDDRQESLSHPSGDLRAFVLWMGPKAQAHSFWD